MECPECGEEFTAPANRLLGNFVGLMISILVSAGVVAIIIAIFWKIIEAIL